MRVNRRFLLWGVFLVAIGGVLVAADVGGLDSGAIADALRLWPLAIIAIGIGIVFRRTRLSLSTGLLAAAVPGLVLGGGFALASRIVLDCGASETPSTVAAQQGVFDGPARISVSTACGSLVVTTAPGSGWQFDGGNSAGREPVIDASARSLSIDGAGGDGWHGHGIGRDNWQLTLPTSAIDDLSIDVNAGEGRINLPGAQLGHLDVTTNAGETTVDLSEASVASLSAAVNAGVLSFQLAAGSDLAGSIEANAGGLEVCVPGELGVRVHLSGALRGMSVEGIHEAGPDWETENYATAAHHADLDVEVNLGNVKINPIGGCK